MLFGDLLKCPFPYSYYAVCARRMVLFAVGLFGLGFLMISAGIGNSKVLSHSGIGGSFIACRPGIVSCMAEREIPHSESLALLRKLD